MPGRGESGRHDANTQKQKTEFYSKNLNHPTSMIVLKFSLNL